MHPHIHIHIHYTHIRILEIMGIKVILSISTHLLWDFFLSFPFYICVSYIPPWELWLLKTSLYLSILSVYNICKFVQNRFNHITTKYKPTKKSTGFPFSSIPSGLRTGSQIFCPWIFFFFLSMCLGYPLEIHLGLFVLVSHLL